MQTIGDSTSTANAAGEYTRGQPAAGVDATMITAEWLNTIQRELINVIVGAGGALDPDDDSQVFKAIQAIQTAAGTWAKLSGKPTTIAGFAITDAFTKTEIGTAFQTQGLTAFTTSGAAPAFTLAPSPAITSYEANQRFRVKFNAAAVAGGTLSVSGLPAKSLKRYDFNGAKIPAIIASGQLADVEYDGADMVVLNALTERDGFTVSPGANGYIRFPKALGSFLIQWGVATSNIAGIDGIALTTSHANTSYVVFCQSRDFTQNVTFGAQSTSPGTFNVTARTSAGLTGSTFHFITLGF